MYALKVENKIAGFAQLEKKSDEQYELEKVTVLPDFRHCGYGRALLNFSKSKVKQLNGKRMTIGIIDENVVLKEWYITNGFVHTGTKKFDHLPFTVGFMETTI